MSLFKACDWWSTSCGADEEFDKGCLTIANIDNSPDKLDKIITGSHSGILLNLQNLNPNWCFIVNFYSTSVGCSQPFKLSVYSVSVDFFPKFNSRSDVFCAKTNSFVNVNGLTVESYRYQSLASASDEVSDGENMVFKGRKLHQNGLIYFLIVP
ncbi:protein PTHB1 [Caerostris extrusa]|uniref:Protein PTHB1 n=1 Tax=Caerostris extrusa TaxID=172846 RepID=A0AAV4XNP0_CAEEX|nr:protein PTHB1 [Caerostris extrusa]